MCEIFNIQVQNSASFSPWSNGVCERHNQTPTNILLKVKDDQSAIRFIAWAVHAKNSLINNNGLSATQLVFSRNTNLQNL